jgi:sigma-B regulation protein RsbU (phosphoserine phosphatase)
MIAAPIPKDDVERLKALHALNLLDTAPEERFDRITRLLTLSMHVPIAYISLVDADRQWFKSACGLTTAQTPRAISFCGHAILSDEPLVVADAAEDERFCDNPLVTGEPYLRFYAGVPLHGPGGHKVGTLCVADRRPRVLSGTDLEALGELARLVERELGLVEIVHLQRDLIASQRQVLRELSQAAKYVRSLLPDPLDGPIRTRWRFEPSSQLGGDCFGYDWLDPEHFAIYLLDVSGHGVGAALLSVSVVNALRARSLPKTDFRDPAAVLTRLNDAFPMERNDDKYLSIWYGVFHRETRLLRFASGGHPPALLMTGAAPQAAKPIELGVENFAIGVMQGISFVESDVMLQPFSKLHVFSDGVYEVRKLDHTMMNREELVAYLASSPGPRDPGDVLRFVQQAAGSENLADDFSLLEVLFS